MEEATVLVEYAGLSAECNIKTVAPATHITKQKDGTYTATNPDGYQRTITAEEFEKSKNVTLVEKLPKTDAMAENMGLSETLSIYGGRKNQQTIWDHLLTASVLGKTNRSIYPFQSKEVENESIEIVTLDNLEGQILNKRMTEWNRFVDTLKTEKQNIIICLEDPVSFSRKQEEELFFSLISDAQYQGKNILVLYRGEKTELVTLKDGIRVISVAYDTATPGTFLQTPTDFLRIHYNKNHMTYEILSEQVFYQK